jgi:hypothetical protein
LNDFIGGISCGQRFDVSSGNGSLERFVAGRRAREDR